MSRQQRRAHESPQTSKSKPKTYAVTVYDSDLEKYAAERNDAYATLNAIEIFAEGLINGPYKNVGEHLLALMFDEGEPHV